MYSSVIQHTEKLPLLSAEAIDPQWRMAAFADVETTGLYCDKDEIIELSVVLFCFDPFSGEIKGVVQQYTGLREPRCPIHPDAYQVHGITLEMLRGKRLDDQAVLSICKRADFLVAHNASFDRGFVCAMYPELSEKRWFCTMNGIAWKRKGFESRALADLLEKHKVRMDKHHRAGFDCMGAVMLLSLPSSEGKTYLKELLEYYERKGYWRTPSLPLTTDEQLVFETIRELVGNQHGLGFYKTKSYISVGFDEGGYWFARYRWGPRSKYIVIKPSNDARDEQKIQLSSPHDLLQHAELIRAACAYALDWYETAKRYAQRGPVREMDLEIRLSDAGTPVKKFRTARSLVAPEEDVWKRPASNRGGCIGLVLVAFFLALVLRSCLR